MLAEVYQFNKCTDETNVETSVLIGSEMILIIKQFDTTAVTNDLLPCHPITTDTVPVHSKPSTCNNILLDPLAPL